MIDETKKTDITNALYKVLGLWSVTDDNKIVPMMTLYHGVLIGLRVGITDGHAARLVELSLGNGDAGDVFVKNVADEILRIADRD